MIFAFHGNLGEPSDWLEVLDFIDRDLLSETIGTTSVELWNLYNCLEASQEIFASKTNEEAKQNKQGKNVLLGYSMGGRLAFHCLAKNPSVWDAAVIVSAHPGLNEEEEKLERLEKDKQWSNLALEKSWAEFWKLWCEQPVLLNSEWGEERPQGPSDAKKIAAAFTNYSLGKQGDLGMELAALKLPVLLVSGGKDPKYSALLANLAEQNSNLEHKIVSDAGHRVLREKPAELAALIGSFLRRCFQAKT